MVRFYQGLASLPEPLSRSVVVVGVLDGVHRGHQALLQRAVAAASGAPVVAYSFDPHPAAVLAPDRAPATLTDISERTRLLACYGADVVVAETFDRDFAALSPKAWLVDRLLPALHPETVVVGFNFSFGRGGVGTPESLTELGKALGFSVAVVPPLQLGEAPVSSSRVRSALATGDVEEAALLLGRAPMLCGVVVRGDGRGRGLGFPTANVDLSHTAVPAPGVYAVRCRVDDPGDAPMDAVMNIGSRPTFAGAGLRVEVHILDRSLDLYGHRMWVEVAGRIRDERRFAGAAELVAQLRLDVETAKQHLRSA